MKFELIKKIGEHTGSKIRKDVYGVFDKDGLLLEEHKTESAMLTSLQKREPTISEELPNGVVKEK